MKGKAGEVAHSLAITSTGVPIIPGSTREFSPDPSDIVSYNEETSSLATSERSSVGNQSNTAREQANNKASLKKELESVCKSHGNHFKMYM